MNTRLHRLNYKMMSETLDICCKCLNRLKLLQGADVISRRRSLLWTSHFLKHNQITSLLHSHFLKWHSQLWVTSFSHLNQPTLWDGYAQKVHKWYILQSTGSNVMLHLNHSEVGQQPINHPNILLSLWFAPLLRPWCTAVYVLQTSSRLNQGESARKNIPGSLFIWVSCFQRWEDGTFVFRTIFPLDDILQQFVRFFYFPVLI